MKKNKNALSLSTRFLVTFENKKKQNAHYQTVDTTTGTITLTGTSIWPLAKR